MSLKTPASMTAATKTEKVKSGVEVVVLVVAASNRHNHSSKDTRSIYVKRSNSFLSSKVWGATVFGRKIKSRIIGIVFLSELESFALFDPSLLHIFQQKSIFAVTRDQNLGGPA